MSGVVGSKSVRREGETVRKKEKKACAARSEEGSTVGLIRGL